MADQNRDRDSRGDDMHRKQSQSGKGTASTQPDGMGDEEELMNRDGTSEQTGASGTSGNTGGSTSGTNTGSRTTGGSQNTGGSTDS